MLNLVGVQSGSFKIADDALRNMGDPREQHCSIDLRKMQISGGFVFFAGD